MALLLVPVPTTLADGSRAAADFDTPVVVSGELEREGKLARRLIERNLDARDTHQVDEAAETYDLTGEGIRVGIWDERGVRTGHQEFREGRATQVDNPWTPSEHATHVAGTIGACGQTCTGGKAQATGMAPAVQILAHDWHRDRPELTAAAANNGIACSNHSYGRRVGWVCHQRDYYSDRCKAWRWYGQPGLSEQQPARFGRYDARSRGIDAVAYAQPTVAIFKAAGNARNRAPANQPIAHEVVRQGGSQQSALQRGDNGILGGYDTLEGMALGKNVITIGAIEDITRNPPLARDIRPTSFTSWGPTDDGRVKPDLVANGSRLYSPSESSDVSYVELSGTSMATPTACGICALLNELAVDRLGRQLYADELKATLIHTAQSRFPGPSFQVGWGSIRADRAAEVVAGDSAAQLLRDRLTPAITRQVVTGEAEAFSSVRATLVWLDPPAPAQSEQSPIDDPTPALINDLDLRLIDPEGKIHYPWSLSLDRDNAFRPESLSKSGPNRVDTVERVDARAGAPIAGRWRLEVSMGTPPVDDQGAIAPQAYALVIEGLDGLKSVPIEPDRGASAAESSDPNGTDENGSAATTAPREPTRHALLIGVSDYSQLAGVADLRGAAHDTALMERVLIDQLGYSKENIRRLLDQEATHCRIRDEFSALADRVRPGDWVYIHYSGHGSEVKDQSSDEMGAVDQTWVTYGARGHGIDGEQCLTDGHDLNRYDILDDQLNRWLAQIEANGGQILFVSDSCHSGSVSRAPGIPRSIDATDFHPLADRPYVPSPLSTVIRVASADDQDSALERIIHGNTPYGLFTWHWAQALQQVKPTDTWEDIFQRSAMVVRQETSGDQRPQMYKRERRLTDLTRLRPDGSASPSRALDRVRFTVLSGDWVVQAPGVRVLAVGSDNSVRLNAGLVAGVTQGSTYRIDPPPEQGEAAMVEITQVEEFVSSARVLNGEVKQGDRLVEVTHVHVVEPTHVRVNATRLPAAQDRPFVDAVRGAVEALEGVTLLPEPSEAHDISTEASGIELYLTRPARDESGAYRYDLTHGRAVEAQYAAEANPEIWLLEAGRAVDTAWTRLQPQPPTPERAAALVKAHLDRYARVKALAELTMRPSHYHDPVILTVRIREPKPGVTAPSDCNFFGRADEDFTTTEIKLPTLDLIRRFQTQPVTQDACLTFTVTNNSENDVYAYLVNITPSHDVRFVFPYPEDAAQYARIPANGRRDYSQREWYGVWFKADTLGRDTLKFLATRRPIDVALLQPAGLATRSDSLPITDPLEHLLAEAIHRRRGTPSRTVAGAWSTTALTLKVHPSP